MDACLGGVLRKWPLSVSLTQSQERPKGRHVSHTQALGRVIIRTTWTALKSQAPGLPAEEPQSPGEGLESCPQGAPSRVPYSACAPRSSRHSPPCLDSFSEEHMFKETASASEGTVGCKSLSEQRIKYLYNYIQAYI